MAKRELVEYDFDHPIRITRYRSGGLDIMFYATLLTLCVLGIFLLLCWHDGQFRVEFTLGRVLLSIPLILIALVLKGMLREIRSYTALLCRKSTWTIEELMELTREDRKETERIMTLVLEASFVVDEKCLRKQGSLVTESLEK